MKNYFFVLIFFSLYLSQSQLWGQSALNSNSDSIAFSGQFLTWANVNVSDKAPLNIGSRFIPTLYMGHALSSGYLLDLELSSNLFASFRTNLSDSFSAKGDFSPYRAWARFSTNQTEIRIGLQKLSFGSATLLRPLMWFDQIDPRDLLQLTDGVWGVLGRYYFLNNANIWLWCLLGNKKLRAWEVGSTNADSPEYGGRVQYPVTSGEVALSYHHRSTDLSTTILSGLSFQTIPENRIGFDVKWDWDVGFWFEGAWVWKNMPGGKLMNQQILNIGVDNTFALGQGLHVVYEQLVVANNSNGLQLGKKVTFSAVSLSYSIDMVNTLGVNAYFDWASHHTYNFLIWNHKLNTVSVILMVYLNPARYQMPQPEPSVQSYSGAGVQFMFVYSF